MIRLSDVTACLVTRGDQPRMMKQIEESLLPYNSLIVWDNSQYPDWKCAGRYMATLLAPTRYVYFQDDDVLVPKQTQKALVREFGELDSCVATYAHGDNPDGYDDLPLVCAGAIADKVACWFSIMQYASRYVLDEDFAYEADFVVGVLYPDFRHLELEFEINYEIAQAPERLCNQDWQRGKKFAITERARAIRDAR